MVPVATQGSSTAEGALPAPRFIDVAATVALAGAALLGMGARRHRQLSAAARRASEGGEASSGTAVAEKPGSEEDEVPFFEEVSGDDPIVLELEERLRKQNGNNDLTLDMVLNPGTIVNTEREVILLRAELAATPEEEAQKRQELEDKIEEKQMKIVAEMRQVMSDNLKIEFLLQAVLSVPLFYAMVCDSLPFYPDWTWLRLTDKAVKLIFRLFGLWGTWLVTVPALRARKPGGMFGMGEEEKRALDINIFVLPFINVLSTALSGDCTVGFFVGLLFIAATYVWSFNTPLPTEQTPSDLPDWLKWTLKALDFSQGRERGARSEDEEWKEQLASYEKAAQDLASAKAKRQQ